MYQLIDRIPTDRYEFMFFCGTPPTHEIEHKVVKTPAITIPFNSTYKAAFPFFKKKQLTKQLDDYAPDVIHIATPSPLGTFAADYAQKNDIPILTIYHTHFISYMEYYFKSVPFFISTAERIVASSYRKFYNRCQLIYVPTEQMIQELIGHGVNKAPLKLWQRGLNQELFDPSKRDLDYLKSITGNDHPSIIYASRLVWEKNVSTLINIYKEIKNRNLPINFIVVGDGVAEDNAKENMPTAHFMGHLSHEKLSVLYASCDMFIFPSISETYGNVVVEAMASGSTPVIARGGGSQSLVQDGVTGYLCEPNDASDYVDKVTYLLQNPSEREKMKAAGLEYTSRLDWEQLADEYFSDIEKLAKKLT